MNKKQRRWLKRIAIALVIFFVIMAADELGALEALLGKDGALWASFLLYLIPYAIAGHDVLSKAAHNIAHGQVFDENFLMAVATIGAFAMVLFPETEPHMAEGAAVMLFYQVGELFQSYAVGKSRKSIADMMDIAPDYANVEDNGELSQVDPDEVAVGSQIVVKAGERIPIDGVICEGTSQLDCAALTGESVPRHVEAGDAVVSGCINMTGLLRIRTTKPFGESTVSRILELVENASEKKAKTENFITRFAHWYTPAVVGVAALLAVVPPLVGAGAWSDWILRGLTFLVVSCPCALVISVPLSFFGGIGGASQIGVLVKGSNYLEALSEVDTVVFDKTGTLTNGSFDVVAVHPVTGVEASYVLAMAAHAEAFSDHPIALSVRRAYAADLGDKSNACADGKHASSQVDVGAVDGHASGQVDVGAVDQNRVDNVQEESGRGVAATVDGHEVLVGNDKLMAERHVDTPACDHVGTILHVAVDGSYVGHIVIADVIKDDAERTIRDLHAAGVRRCIMLTGDREEVAAEVAARLGLDDHRAELLPADKVEAVERLLADEREGAKVAFVGDGINDAPVLTRADVGIAMGAMGSDAAIEAADIVLMDDKPSNISRAMRVARKTMRIVWQNIVFALAVKLVILVLAALGIANMWLAVFGDVGVAIIAILNAMRCMRVD